MAIYKVTFAFVSGVCGWSENYYSEAGTGTAAVQLARELAKKRIALCGDGVALPHIRVSEVSVRGDALLDDQPGYFSGAGGPTSLIQIKNATPNEFADVAWTAALITYSSANIAYARTYMRGIADILFLADRVFSPTQAWKAAFNIFSKEIGNAGNGWGWFRQPKQTPANTWNILGAVAAVGDDLLVTVAAGFPGIVGQTVKITGLKSTRGVLNGTFKILAAPGAIITLQKQFPADSIPIFVPNTGKIMVYAPTFLTPLTATFSYEATSRRAGRPFGSPVGRRKKVVVLR